MWASVAPHPHRHLALSFFLYFSHSSRYEEVSDCAFKLYFPNNGSLENTHTQTLGRKKGKASGKNHMLAEAAPFLSGIPGSPTQQLVIAYHWPELVSGPSLCARKIEKCS